MRTTSVALVAWLALGGAALAVPGDDHWSTPLTPDQTARFDRAKAMIKAEQFAQALPVLKALSGELGSNADVFNLLGFA